MTNPLVRFKKEHNKRLRIKKYTKNWASKFFTGHDIQNFDINARIDSYISLEENKTILLPKIKSMVGLNACITRSDIRSIMLPYGSELSTNDKLRHSGFRNLIVLHENKIKDVSSIMKKINVNQRTAYDYLYTLKGLGLIK